SAACDPAANGFELCFREFVFLAGRHLAVAHHLIEQAVVGLAGHYHGPGLAAFEKPGPAAEIKRAFPHLVAVAAQTFRREERLNISLETERRRGNRKSIGLLWLFGFQ